MKCPNCGAEIRNGGKFCPKCGSEVTLAQTEQGVRKNKALGISIIVIATLTIIAATAFFAKRGINSGIENTVSQDSVKEEQTAPEDEKAFDNAEDTLDTTETGEEKDLAVSYDALAEAYVQEIENIKEESINLVKEYNSYYAQNFDPDNELLFNLADVDGDGVFELYSSDSEGSFAWMSVYYNGDIIRHALYNTYENPDGYTDYGSYAYIDCENSRIIRCEYDCTLEEDGNYTYPGSEIFEEGPYDYYSYITVYRLNDNKDLEFAEKYELQEHYEGDICEVVSATKNDEQLTISDPVQFYEMVNIRSDVDFGSGQAQGDGISADKMEKSLTGIFKASHDFITGDTLVNGAFADIYADDMDSDVFGIFFFDVDNDDEYELLISKYYGYDIYDYRDGSLQYLTGVEGTAGACSIYCHNDGVYICHSDTSHLGRQLYTFDRYNGDGDITDTVEISAEYWDQSEPDINSDYTYCGQSITMDEYQEYLKGFYELSERSFVNYPCGWDFGHI